MADARVEDDQAAGGESPIDMDKGRRAAIAKMAGTLAAPALVMLLTADAAEAWSASGRPGRPRHHGRPRHRGRRS